MIVIRQKNVRVLCHITSITWKNYLLKIAGLSWIRHRLADHRLQSLSLQNFTLNKNRRSKREEFHNSIKPVNTGNWFFWHISRQLVTYRFWQISFICRQSYSNINNIFIRHNEISSKWRTHAVSLDVINNLSMKNQ